MIFQRIIPDVKLADIVDCFWIVENEDPTPVIQKIIPDGFPEIIFHYKDPYSINFGVDWQLQDKSLLAGQVKKHFFLRTREVRACSVSSLSRLHLAACLT